MPAACGCILQGPSKKDTLRFGLGAEQERCHEEKAEVASKCPSGARRRRLAAEAEESAEGAQLSAYALRLETQALLRTAGLRVGKTF